jgi:hypothetical protein
MHDLLLAASGISDWWFAMPLVIVVSLVYSATRHEQMGPIVSHAVRIGVWIVGFMFVVFLVLLLIAWLV